MIKASGGNRVATRRSFTQEYRDQAVSLHLDSGRSIAEVARSIGVHEMTLGKWVKKMKDSGRVQDKDLSETGRAEPERLRKDNAVLRMERDFANEPSRTSRRGACSAKKEAVTVRPWKNIKASYRPLPDPISLRFMNKHPGPPVSERRLDTGGCARRSWPCGSTATASREEADQQVHHNSGPR
jgi:transposase